MSKKLSLADRIAQLVAEHGIGPVAQAVAVAVALNKPPSKPKPRTTKLTVAADKSA